MDCKFMDKEMFGSSESFSSDSDNDLVSSSSSLVVFIMELSTSSLSSFCEEVLSLDSLCLKDN